MPAGSAQGYLAFLFSTKQKATAQRSDKFFKDFMSFAIVNSLNTFWIHAFIYLTHFCKYHIHSFLNLALFMDEGYLIYSKLISVLKKITTITYMSVTQVGSNVLQVSQKKKTIGYLIWYQLITLSLKRRESHLRSYF